MKVALMCMSFAIWISSYWICEFYFSNSVEEWWKLRMILYAIVYFLSIAANGIYGKSRAVLFFNVLFMGIVLEDITDRLFFDSRNWEFNDWIAIDFSIAAALLLTFKNKIYDGRH